MAETRNVLVPDIGNFKDVAIIEVSVKPGDSVAAEQSLLTLETDKATMDVPAPFDGVIKEVKVKVGDKVSEGSLIAVMEAADTTATSAPTTAPQTASPATPAAPAPQPTPATVPAAITGNAHASPSVRRFARELGVDLSRVAGSGEKGRVTKDDVQNFVKQALADGAGDGMPGLLPWPDVDGTTRYAQASGAGVPSHHLLPQTAGFASNVSEVNFSKFGEVESKPLSRIKKISGANLHRNWMMIPHVTQFEEADISELEAFRKELGAEYAKENFKITLLAFLLKACAIALRQFPDFNVSLDAGGENLIVKKYVHIGVAVDTPEGLMVPVIRDVDQKGIVQLAKELGEVSQKARDKKLPATDMQGGCFTISSLGGIGGTCFTPIINAPEVAILGVSRAIMKPVWKNGEFVPRLMLPLSLTYDHRVIDGAAGARFAVYLTQVLSDMRHLAL